MSKLKSLKAKTINSNIAKIEEEKENRKYKSDPRYLNYYDLDFGEKMVVRFLPDGGDSDDLWFEYCTHGKGLKNDKISAISCANTSNGEKCPACGKSYGYHLEGEKDLAKMWRRKEVFVAQCIVIDSPVDVNEADDGNLVKLIYLPFSMLDVIKDALTDEDEFSNDLYDYEFTIKKTKKRGTDFAEYTRSSFNSNSDPLPEEIAEAIEEGNIYLYDLSKEAPDAATAEEVQEWLTKAEVIMEGVSSSDDDSKSSDGNDKKAEEKETSVSKKVSSGDLKERLRQRASK